MNFGQNGSYDQKMLQGVQKWNVFFESASVVKLLHILTRSDFFNEPR